MQTPSSKNFPVVSMGKFTLLYFATAGMYTLYWFYACWRGEERRTGRKLFPVVRALFSVFFVHTLFNIIYKENQKTGNEYRWNPARVAWVFVAAYAGEAVFLIFSEQLMVSRFVYMLISIVGLFVQYYALYTVQLVINRVGQDPYGRDNEKLTVQNNLWIAFGVFLWVDSFYICYLDLTGQLPEVGVEAPADSNTFLE